MEGAPKYQPSQEEMKKAEEAKVIEASAEKDNTKIEIIGEVVRGYTGKEYKSNKVDEAQAKLFEKARDLLGQSNADIAIIEDYHVSDAGDMKKKAWIYLPVYTKKLEGKKALFESEFQEIDTIDSIIEQLQRIKENSKKTA